MIEDVIDEDRSRQAMVTQENYRQPAAADLIWQRHAQFTLERKFYCTLATSLSARVIKITRRPNRKLAAKSKSG